MKPTRGFTLIELLVVIALIGLLASIVLTSLNSARGKARDSKRISDLRNMQTALEVYAANNNGVYPVVSVWQSQCIGWGGYPGSGVIPGIVPTYMASMPVDPGMIANSNRNCYLYESNGSDYKILDYGLTSDVDVAAQPAFIDPLRNSGKSWQIPSSPAGPCTNNGDVSSVWAVWSGVNSQCW